MILRAFEPMAPKGLVDLLDGSFVIHCHEDATQGVLHWVGATVALNAGAGYSTFTHLKFEGLKDLAMRPKGGKAIDHMPSPFLFHCQDQEGHPTILNAGVSWTGLDSYFAEFDMGAIFGTLQFKFSQCSIRNRIGVYKEGKATRRWNYQDRETGARFAFDDPFGIYPALDGWH